LIDIVDLPRPANTYISGASGELLTAYVLTRVGLHATLVDAKGPDIWCRTQDGSIFTVEVKTAIAPTPRGVGKPRSYSFQVPDRQADIFAFVALDKERVLFKLPDSLPTYTTVRINPEEFEIRNVLASLDFILADQGIAA
jgi:hypothetical protein